MLDFHWIKAMLFFGKFYDFLQFFLHQPVFLGKYHLQAWYISIQIFTLPPPFPLFSCLNQ